MILTIFLIKLLSQIFHSKTVINSRQLIDPVQLLQFQIYFLILLPLDIIFQCITDIAEKGFQNSCPKHLIHTSHHKVSHPVQLIMQWHKHLYPAFFCPVLFIAPVKYFSLTASITFGFLGKQIIRQKDLPSSCPDQI